MNTGSGTLVPQHDEMQGGTKVPLPSSTQKRFYGIYE